MNYIVVFGIGPEALEEKVNATLQLGWKLQGGIAVRGEYFFQAMIKTNKVLKNGPITQT